MRSEGFYVKENSTDTSWDRTKDLPICSTTLIIRRFTKFYKVHEMDSGIFRNLRDSESEERNVKLFPAG